MALRIRYDVKISFCLGNYNKRAIFVQKSFWRYQKWKYVLIYSLSLLSNSFAFDVTNFILS